jgi:hypothetical protein
MGRISSLQRQLRFAVVVALGLVAAALPGFSQGRPHQASAVCLGLPAQMGMAVGMLILTFVIYMLLTMTKYNQVSAEADRCEL